MAKDKLVDYDSTASGNLDVGGISVAEGMLPSNVNNAIREQMSHLKDFADGTEAINALAVDNLKMDGNTISSTDTNGDITLDPNGTGVVALSSTDLTFGDNDKAIFGAGSDLQIYHDGNHSYVTDQGDGNLRLRGSNFVQVLDASGNDMIQAEAGGAVDIYHNGSSKFATIATGVNVTGTVQGDALVIDGNSVFNGNAFIDQGAIGGNTLSLDRTGADGTLGFFNSGTQTALISGVSGGGINAYVGSTPSLALAINASGNVGIGGAETTVFTGAGGDMKFVVIGDDSTTTVANNSDAGIAIVNTNQTAGNLAGLHFARADTDDSPNYAGASIVARFPEAQVTGQYPKGELAFLTSTNTNNAPSEKVRIDASGNLLLGYGGQTTTAFGQPQGVSIGSLDNVALQYYLRKGNQVEARIGFKEH